MAVLPVLQQRKRLAQAIMQWVGTICLAITQRQADQDPVLAAGTAANVTTSTESFETFFFRHERQIIGYLWRMTGDEDSARDLCQETFLRAWQQFDHVRACDSPRSWLFRVATNLALNDIRSRSRVQHFTLLDEQAATAITRDATAQVGERENIRQILQMLPAKQRAVLVLRSVYGIPWDELGHMLGMSKHGLQKTLFRAREQFRVRYLRKEQ